MVACRSQTTRAATSPAPAHSTWTGTCDESGTAATQATWHWSTYPPAALDSLGWLPGSADPFPSPEELGDTHGNHRVHRARHHGRPYGRTPGTGRAPRDRLQPQPGTGGQVDRVRR